MTSPDVTQILVAGQRTGIIGLPQVLQEVAAEFEDRPDEEIQAELLQRLSAKNYIVDKVRDAYGRAFLREYKKFIGQPVEDDRPEVPQIKVLGPGCPNCDRLEQELMGLMAELGLPADLEHIRDVVEIGRYGVMSVPALVINGKVVAAGSIPPRKKLKALLQDAAKK
jgi:small redox-active disulfide protein 2